MDLIQVWMSKREVKITLSKTQKYQYWSTVITNALSEQLIRKKNRDKTTCSVLYF